LIQGCLLGEASLGYPSDVSDAAWEIIAPLLPSERGRWARPAQDNRRYFNGMMWIMRTGAPWRYLPPDYGKWNSVYVRFRRWDAILETLVELGLTDDWAHMMDSTTVRAHAQAAGGKGGLIQMLLVEAAAAFRQRSTPGQTVKDALLALSSQAAKPRTIAA
jgi:transposase